MKRNKIGYAFLFALMPLMMSGCAGCQVVGPGERGIKVKMGVVDNSVLPPGMHWYNGFLMEDIVTRSVKMQTVQGSALPLTSDQQPLKIDFRVQYRYPEGQLLNLYQNVKGDPYETLVVPQIQESFRQVVSQHKAEAITGGVNMIKDQVLALTRKNVNGMVDVVDIPITHIELPEALQSSIIQKQQMEIDAKKKQYELDKEKKQAEITIARAQAEAESIRLQSQALANSPKLVDLKWVEKWDGHLPETVAGDSALIVGGMKK